MRNRVNRAIVAAGFGPLCFDGDNGGAPGDGGTPPADGGTGGGGGTPPAGNAGGQDDRSGWIPRQRFDEVNSRLQAYEREKQEREAEDLRKKGEHEQLANREKAAREAAEAKALRVARRASFIGAAAGKVADPEAAYKLAAADGLLDDLDVDDDGNAKDAKKPAGIVDELLKRYTFLKSDKSTRDFGEPRNGASGSEPGDPSKMSAQELLRSGFAQSRR